MRIKTIIKIASVIIIVIIVALVVILKSMDFNKYLNLITQKVQEATGRELKINGELKLNLSFSPALTVEDITFANASWGSRPKMVQLKRLDIKVNLIPLIFGNIRIKRFVLIEPDILLETNSEGKGNWILDREEKARAHPDKSDAEQKEEIVIPVINEVRIKKANLTYRDGRSQKSTNFMIKSLTGHTRGLKSPFNLDIDGSYNNIHFKVAGEFGSFGQLTNPSVPFPVQLEARLLNTLIKVNGTIKKPMEGKGLNLKLSLESPDIGKLSKLAETQLPSVGPLHITAHLTDSEKTYSFRNFNVNIGRSKLGGKVSVKMVSEIPSVNVNLTTLDLDLTEFKVPADKKEKKGKEKPAKSKGKKKRIFSNDPLPLDGLRKLDADIKINGNRILANGIELKNPVLNLKLNKGILSIYPLKGNIAGGNLSLNISLNAARNRPVPTLNLKMNIKNADLGVLLKDMKITDLLSSGKVDVEIDLRGKGESLQTLMAGLNGKTILIMGEGKIKNKFVDFIAADLVKLITPGGMKKDLTKINCFVNRFDIKQGLAQNKWFLFDTEEITVMGEGDINLATEKLNLKMRPKPKQKSLLSLAVPINIRGTLSEPSVRPDTKSVVTGAAGAVIGTMINPLGLLVPFISKGTGDKNPCLEALTQSKKDGTRSQSIQQEDSGGVKGFLKGLGNALKSKE